MGLIVSVFENKELGNSSNGGISSKYSSLTVVNIPGPFEPHPDRPAVLLHSHVRGVATLVPAVQTGNKWVPFKIPGVIGPMAGGSYAGSSDSRFGVAVANLLGCDMTSFYGLIPIHDRFESEELYNTLSR